MLVFNIGLLERVARLLAAALWFNLGSEPGTHSLVAFALTAIATLAALTGLTGFCGIYRLLGTSTRANLKGLY